MKNNFEFKYRLLQQLKEECEQWLNGEDKIGFGNTNVEELWAGSSSAQIEKMQNIYEELPEKPDWLTQEQLYQLATDMDVYLHSYKTTRDEWIADNISPEVYADTQALYIKAMESGELSSSDTFNDYIAEYGFADGSFPVYEFELIFGTNIGSLDIEEKEALSSESNGRDLVLPDEPECVFIRADHYPTYEEVEEFVENELKQGERDGVFDICVNGYGVFQNDEGYAGKADVLRKALPEKENKVNKKSKTSIEITD